MTNQRKNKKRPRDLNQLALSIVDETVSEEPEVLAEEDEKNPHAVALGRLGGLKGGPARAKKLDPARLSEIAQQAAFTRWRRDED